MRRFTLPVTEIDFVDGNEASDKAAQDYEKHLSETLQNAAQKFFAMVAALQHQTHVETRPAEKAEVKRTHRAKQFAM